jgi:hypothetical protein
MKNEKTQSRHARNPPETDGREVNRLVRPIDLKGDFRERKYPLYAVFYQHNR